MDAPQSKETKLTRNLFLKSQSKENQFVPQFLHKNVEWPRAQRNSWVAAVDKRKSSWAFHWLLGRTFFFSTVRKIATQKISHFMLHSNCFESFEAEKMQSLRICMKVYQQLFISYFLLSSLAMKLQGICLEINRRLTEETL